MSATGLTSSPAALIIESFQSSFVSGGRGSICIRPQFSSPIRTYFVTFVNLLQVNPVIVGFQWGHFGCVLIDPNTAFICVLI